MEKRKLEINEENVRLDKFVMQDNAQFIKNPYSRIY